MTDLTVIQATVLANEVSLAKNYAIKSNNIASEVKSDLNLLKQEVYVNDSSLNLVISKLQNLCDLLVIADISGVSDASLNYNNL